MIDPNVGYLYDYYDGLFKAAGTYTDSERYIIHSTGTFPSPMQSVHWAYLNERAFPDGVYMVKTNPAGGTTPPGGYSVIVIGGVQNIASTPVSGLITETPTVSILTGRELTVSGTPIIGAQVSASISTADGTANHIPYGTIRAFTTTQTDVNGNWAIPLVLSDSIMPSVRYRVSVIKEEIGSKSYDNLFIPNTDTISAVVAQMWGRIKDAEIVNPYFQIDTKPAGDHYCRVRAVLVDSTGRPISGKKVIFSIAKGSEPAYLKPSTTAPSEFKQALMLETAFETTSARSLDMTISCYPDVPKMTVTIPAGSELVSVVDGLGQEKIIQKDFSFNPTSRILTFNKAFVGTIKHRRMTSGEVFVDLPQGHEYWVQIGLNTLRKPFIVPSGKATLDLGYLNISC